MFQWTGANSVLNIKNNLGSTDYDVLTYDVIYIYDIHKDDICTGMIFL